MLEMGAGLSNGNSIVTGTLKKRVQTWDSGHIWGLSTEPFSWVS